MSKIWNIGWIILLTVMILAACRQDLFLKEEKGAGEIILSAYKEQIQARATGAEEYFDLGTRYRIWINQSGTTNPVAETENGIQGTESVRGGYNTRYIDLGTYNTRLSGEFDFYGFTAATEQPIKECSVCSDYEIELQSDGDYIDYRRGQLLVSEHEESSGVLRMPFKHIMSQVRLEVMKEETVTSELELVSVEFIGSGEGVVTEGTYNVYTNAFTHSITGVREVCSVNQPIQVPSSVDNEAAEVGTILVFPESEKLPLYYLRVTFNDPSNFYHKGSTNVHINVPIYDNRATTASRPLHFVQNTSYTLCITFMSNQARIVTLVPKVYEWIDGETESVHDGEYYQEQDLGQPITFNGVMWSDRNLGATSAHPTRGIDDWNKSVGYFYQYGRNIPYFPNSLNADGTINLNTPLAEALVTEGDHRGKNFIYPVINFSSWNLEEQSINIAPSSELNCLVWKQGIYDDQQNRWGYSTNINYIPEKYLSTYDYGWENNTNTPCPSGWRLPTIADYRGIIPGTGYSGNITFRKYTQVDSNGRWLAEPNNAEPDFNDIFSKGKISEYPAISGFQRPIYGGFFPCIYREEQNDPEMGSKSKYILSMMDEEGYRDWNRVSETAGELKTGDSGKNYVYNWGVIYAIKKQGTAAAYRIKWEVKLISEDANPQWENNNNRLVYKKPFRGVLVISRYQASASDDFKASADGSYKDAVKQFDWNHPVEVMYMPVGGFADNWSGGKLGNIGTELWYAISDRPSKPERKNIFWFKFAGTDVASQTMVISDKSYMNAAVQIRCVRDLTHK